MNPFESATRSAIEEILKTHLCQSKYGYFITSDSMEALRDELAKFWQTSRELKARGDALLRTGTLPSSQGKSKSGATSQ